MTLAPEFPRAVETARQITPAPYDQTGRQLPRQAPEAVLMVRPHRFRPNPQTLVDNAFMSVPAAPASRVARTAYREVSTMVRRLRRHGVNVLLVEDTGTGTPDSVFPNNWFTTHPDGSLAVFPMRAPDRRAERRADILGQLSAELQITSVRDYSPWEQTGRFLEGTGVMVLDHRNRIAYVCRSARADEWLLRRFCADHDYRPVVFDATDPAGVPIYHTNVMMAVGSTVAIVALDAVPDFEQRARLIHELEQSGREIVPISSEQVAEFAGNSLELWTGSYPLLVISSRGWRSLDRSQRRRLEVAHEVLPVDVPTIEHAGGSARCMMAGIHAPRR